MTMTPFMSVKAAVRKHAAYIALLKQRDLNAFCLNGLHGNSDVGYM
jgi:hypothetical protein